MVVMKISQSKEAYMKKMKDHPCLQATDEALEELREELRGFEHIKEMIFKSLNINDIDDIPAPAVETYLKRVRNLKYKHKG